MLSGLFDLYLPLNNPSKSYRRLVGMVFGLALFVWIRYCEPPILINVMIGISLSYAVWQLFRYPHPYAKLQSLRLQRGFWIVEDIQGQCTAYTEMRMVVDTGLYLVLHLSGGNHPARLLVIFYDQISIDTLRQVNRLTKIKSIHSDHHP